MSPERSFLVILLCLTVATAVVLMLGLALLMGMVVALKRPVVVTAHEPRRHRPPNATAEASRAFPRIVGRPSPAGEDLSAEEHRRRGEAAAELFRELERRATWAERGLVSKLWSPSRDDRAPKRPPALQAWSTLEISGSFAAVYNGRVSWPLRRGMPVLAAYNRRH